MNQFIVILWTFFITFLILKNSLAFRIVAAFVYCYCAFIQAVNMCSEVMAV